MSKEIEDFVALIGYELKSDKKERDNATPIAENFRCGIVAAMEFLVESDEYQALKDSIKPKLCGACDKLWDIEHSCKKQAPIDYLWEASGYKSMLPDTLPISMKVSLLKGYLEQKD